MGDPWGSTRGVGRGWLSCSFLLHCCLRTYKSVRFGLLRLPSFLKLLIVFSLCKNAETEIPRTEIFFLPSRKFFIISQNLIPNILATAEKRFSEEIPSCTSFLCCIVAQSGALWCIVVHCGSLSVAWWFRSDA